MAHRAIQLALLTVALTVGIYAKSALGPLQESMRLALALSDNQIALLQGLALALPMIVIGVPLGLIVDRVRRVSLLFVCVVLILAGSVLTALASDFTLLFAARSLVGLALMAMVPVTFSLRADLYGPTQRGRANMVTLVAQFGGVSAAFAAGGALMTMFGPGPEAWRSALLWMSVPPLIAAALLMFGLREPPRAERLSAQPLTVAQSFTALWSFRAVVAPILAGWILVLVALGSLMIWSAPALTRAFALSAGQVGGIMAVAIPVGGMTGTIAGGFLTDLCVRLGGARRTVMVSAGLALVAAPICLFALMPGAAVATVTLTAAIAVLTAICVVMSTVAANVIPNDIRGLYSGVSSTLGSFLSVGVAPLLVSSLSGPLGGPEMIGHALALVCAAGCGLAAAVLFFSRRAYPG